MRKITTDTTRKYSLGSFEATPVPRRPWKVSTRRRQAAPASPGQRVLGAEATCARWSVLTSRLVEPSEAGRAQPPPEDPRADTSSCPAWVRTWRSFRLVSLERGIAGPLLRREALHCCQETPTSRVWGQGWCYSVLWKPEPRARRTWSKEKT